MDKVNMFPEIDLIDAFLDLYNRVMILNKGGLGENEGDKDNGNNNVIETKNPPNLDDSDYILKDFNPLSKSNVWLDQSLDK